MNDTPKDSSLIKHFQYLPDPRFQLKSDHKLIDIVIIAICAVICGADKWTQIEEFGKERQVWFETFLELPNGIPSHDTFGRVFSLLDPMSFQNCFQGWIKSVVELTEGQVIALDGKTLRRSHDNSRGKKAIHIVHAWATSNGVLLGQVKVKEKSNEITAIPDLLDLIAVKGCIVSIDAMGCQKKIAEKIHDHGADYILAVKGNQGTLNDNLEKTFEIAQEKGFEAMVYDIAETVDGDHGRIETRTCYVLPSMYLFQQQIKWRGLKSLIMIRSERHEKSTGESTTENRYYISSLDVNAEKALRSIRSHWGVENNLHWSLDVGFREDECRSRIGDSAENFSLIRKIVLFLLKKEKAYKGGIQSKRLKAAWSQSYLLKVLAG